MAVLNIGRDQFILRLGHSVRKTLWSGKIIFQMGQKVDKSYRVRGAGFLKTTKSLGKKVLKVDRVLLESYIVLLESYIVLLESYIVFGQNSDTI